jgi:hypothetical protein
MDLIEPLSKRREAEMRELRTKAGKGNKAAAAELKRRCRAGALVPNWGR